MNAVSVFNIQWSKWVKTMTLVLSILIILSAILISYALFTGGFTWIGLSFFIVIPLVYLSAMAFAPISIFIDKDTFVIKRIFGSKTISRSDIAEAYTYEHNEYMLKLIGSSGLFGYTGIFKSKKEGRVFSYVGDYDQAFILVLNNKKKYLISSEDRDTIISILNENL